MLSAREYFQRGTYRKFSLRAALKEFFQPLRTNDSRADFFAIYHRESEEFDRDYARKYDEDLNTSLIFVSRPRPLLAPSASLLISEMDRPDYSQQFAQRSSLMSSPS